jgi:hypothetical protein
MREHVDSAMRRRTFLSLLPAATRGAGAEPRYLGIVRKFADTLLAKGLDTYGREKTPLWAGVIDTATLTAPADAKEVPAPEGIRTQDRAVGGCNAYHDAVTWRVFQVLGRITGDARYARAVGDYATFFLRRCQNPKTGLLAWGEHLYYGFYQDEVAASRQWHELLEWTPPYPLLWEFDSQAVAREIAGIRYHFYADDPASLFNRHAWWDRAEHQKPGGQPWIKHTGLYAYAFSFLHSKTRDPLWLRWARGPAELYWKHRNPETNLTLGCIDDPRPGSKQASSQMPELAYWLYKAWQFTPSERAWRERARTYLASFDRYFWDRRQEAFVPGLELDGTRVGNTPMRVWNIGYGETGPLNIGRIAAYIGRNEKEPVFLDIAKRAGALARRTPVPDDVSQEALAFALNLSLDLYDSTGDAGALADARRYADTAIERYWVERDQWGLFVRAPKDRYYEAKVATGDLLAGLTRLHLRATGAKDPGVYDWSY